MNIETITVLGANGTMGRNVSAIFASFGSARVYMVCRTKEKAEKAVIQAFQSVKAESIRDKLIPATYDELEECISDSDLIFESLSEDFEVKKDIYHKIKLFIKDNAVISTGTSGLSIKELAKSFDDKANNFFGIHMFNPPYSLTLCELVIHSESQRELAKKLKDYLSTSLKRSVVEVKDSPSFLGNRIGFYFIGEALKLAKENMNQGGVDYIDSVLGCFTGRNMTPLVTADFVGLDVTKSIIDYIYEEINDEFNDSFSSPEYFNDLVNDGKLGKKSEYGLYYKDRDRNLIFVYDIKQKSYRLKNDYQFYFVNEMINKIQIGDYKKAISILIDDESHEAVICKQMLLKYIAYALKISYEVSNDISSCDDAMATGFSWLPPIAMIELFGGIESVRKLTVRYLDKKYTEIYDNQDIINNLPRKSKYDYRSYLKARY